MPEHIKEVLLNYIKVRKQQDDPCSLRVTRASATRGITATRVRGQGKGKARVSGM